MPAKYAAVAAAALRGAEEYRIETQAAQRRPEAQPAGAPAAEPGEGNDLVDRGNAVGDVDRRRRADQRDPRGREPRAQRAQQGCRLQCFRHPAVDDHRNVHAPNGIACDALRAGLRVWRAIDVAVQPYGWMSPSLAGRDLLSIADLTTDEIITVLDLADAAKAGRDLGSPLAGRSLALIFQRPSNRTRVSFEVAIHRLGGHPIALFNPEVQLGERESAADISRILDRYADGIVARLVSHRDLVTIAGAATVPGDQRPDGFGAPLPGPRRLHDRAIGRRAGSPVRPSPTSGTATTSARRGSTRRHCSA